MYEAEFNGKKIKVVTKVSLLSPQGAERGTVAMLRHAGFTPEDKVLDLGCGTGIVSLAACCFGVSPSNITMTDVDPDACTCSRENMESNGFEGATVVCGDALEAVTDKGYTVILSNPPYHTDFKVAKTFIEKGFNRLAVGGRMLLVTKRKDWYKNKMISVFGGVRIFEEDGYFIFVSNKRSEFYAKKGNKKR